MAPAEDSSETVDCCIIGGGPVGLFTSIVLSRLGVTNVVLEKHPGTTLHPKARNVSAHVVLLKRVLGVDLL